MLKPKGTHHTNNPRSSDHLIDQTSQSIDDVLMTSNLMTEDEFFSHNVIGSGLSDISMLSSQAQILGQALRRRMREFF